MTTIQAFFLSLFLTIPASLCGQPPTIPAQEEQTGLLYGPKHAYSLTAPTGWVLDSQAWADAGIHAVFYPKGSSPQGSRVAYTRFFPPHKQGAEGCSAEDLIKFKIQNPSVQIKTYPNIRTTAGMKAVIRSTRTDEVNNAEWIAYIEAPTGIIFIAVVTKTPAELESLRLPFDQLLNSCMWLTDKVQIQ